MSISRYGWVCPLNWIGSNHRWRARGDRESTHCLKRQNHHAIYGQLHEHLPEACRRWPGRPSQARRRCCLFSPRRQPRAPWRGDGDLHAHPPERRRRPEMRGKGTELWTAAELRTAAAGTVHGSLDFYCAINSLARTKKTARTISRLRESSNRGRIFSRFWVTMGWI
jgi:hypothetical protein